MSVMFTYNQEQALKCGQSLFIQETGAYLVKILTAKYTTSQKGAQAIELSVETQDGLKADYISIFYRSAQGEDLKSGQNMIQAIMGCTGVKTLTQALRNDVYIVPELEGKSLGLVLQKVLYTKNDGSDGHRFQIVCPYGASTGKTLSEHIENRPAERIEHLRNTLKDKDERNKGYSNTPYQAPPQQQQPPSQANSFDDDIPF